MPTQYAQPRHARLCSLLTDALVAQSVTAIPAAVAVGNSIVQGKGASTYAKCWVWGLAAQLQAYYGIGVAQDWAATNYGVGGSTIDTVACYLADDGDNVPVKPGRIFSLGQYFLVMSIRNSAGIVPLSDYAIVLRACIRQIRRCGLDAIFVSENPKITWSGSSYTVYDNASNWTPWLNAAQQVCAEEGATFVDVWSDMMMLESQAAGSIGQYVSADGTHPNDAGHALIANLVYEAIVSPVEPNPAWLDRRADATGKTYLASKYVLQGIAQESFTIATNATARQVQRNEASAYAYPMVNGSQMFLSSPIPACGLILDLLNGPSNTGQASVAYDGVATGTYGPADGTFVLEGSFHHFWLPGSADIGNTLSGAAVTANGPVDLIGVVWVGIDASDCQPVPSNPAAGGSWMAGTMQPGGPLTTTSAAIQNATVGNTLTVNWYGTSLSVQYARGVSFGMFNHATDAGPPSSNVDGYLDASETSACLQIVKNLAEGWHTTVFTIAAKNTLSNANTVRLCNFIGYRSAPMPSTNYIAMIAGESRTIKGSWKRAAIERVLSGSPAVYPSAPSVPTWTLTLNGTGAAIIRLER